MPHGFPERISRNIAVELDVTNGTLRVIADYQFNLSTQFGSTNLKGVEMFAFSEPPVRVVTNVKNLRTKSRTKIVPDKYHQTNLSIVSVSESVEVQQTSKIFHIQVTQIPHSAAYAITTYELQFCRVYDISWPGLGGKGCKSSLLHVKLQALKT